MNRRRRGNSLAENSAPITQPTNFETALRTGDLPAVKAAVSNGQNIEAYFDIEEGGGSKISSIMYAAYFGHEHIVEFLDSELKKKYIGRNPFNFLWHLATWQSFGSNLKSSSGVTFLHTAVWGGNLNLVKKSIEEYKIDPNCYYIRLTESGYTYKSYGTMDGQAVKMGYGITPIGEAAAEGHLDIVTYLANHGANLNRFPITVNKLPRPGLGWDLKNRSETMTIFSIPPLHDAVRNGHVPIIDFLLARGVSIESYDHLGYTPIIAAAEIDDPNICVEMVRYLVEKDASFFSKGNGWYDRLLGYPQEVNITVIQKAIQTNNVVYARELQKCGLFYVHEPSIVHMRIEPTQDRNGTFVWVAQRKEQRTVPLAWRRVIENNDPRMLKILFSEPTVDHFNDELLEATDATSLGGENRVDIFHQHTDQLLLFAYARTGEVQKMQRLLSTTSRTLYADVNGFDEDGNTALHFAGKNGQTDVAKFLLRKFASPNATNRLNETPLVTALNHKASFETVRTLLQETDLAIEDNSGLTALVHSIKAEDIRVFELILRKALTVNISLENKYGERGFTLFLHAVAWNCKAVLIKLLEQNVNNRACDQEGNNALMICAADKNNSLGMFLIEQGIPIDAKNNQGQTAFSIALVNDHLNLCINLIASRLLFLIAAGQCAFNQENCAWLFTLGGARYQSDAYSRTLLHVAAGMRNEDFSKYLLEEKSVDPSLVDGNDRTAEDAVNDEEYNNIRYDFSDIENNLQALYVLANANNKLTEVKKLIKIYKPELSQDHRAITVPQARQNKRRQNAPERIEIGANDNSLFSPSKRSKKQDATKKTRAQSIPRSSNPSKKR